MSVSFLMILKAYFTGPDCCKIHLEISEIQLIREVFQSNLCRPNTNFDYMYIRKMDKNSINMMQLLRINFRATYWIWTVIIKMI